MQLQNLDGKCVCMSHISVVTFFSLSDLCCITLSLGLSYVTVIDVNCLSEDHNFLFLQVTDALAQAGLELSNLIVGIDFTKSNERTGYCLWSV